MAVKRLFILGLLTIVLLFSYQNCGKGNDVNFLGSAPCTGLLCTDTGVGLLSSVSISVNQNELIIPYTTVAPYKFKVNGTCSDGGFKRNKIIATLRENQNSLACANNPESYTVTTKCQGGSFIIEQEFVDISSICDPTNNPNAFWDFQVEIVGVDSFDNEYRPAHGTLVYQVPIIKTKLPPQLNTLANGNATNLWSNYIVYKFATDTIQLQDLHGYCDYVPTALSANDYNNPNRIHVHIKPTGASDSQRLTFLTPGTSTGQLLGLTCQQLTAQVDPYAFQNRGNYDGYFKSTGVQLFMPYQASPNWPGFTGVAAQYNARNFTIILDQPEPAVSASYRIESTNSLTLKYSSPITAQDWTLEILSEAMKRVMRGLNQSWDDSNVSDSDLQAILSYDTGAGSARAFGFRDWVLNEMQLVENSNPQRPGTVTSVGFPNAFYERLGKIAFGSRRCDTRLINDMGGTQPGSWALGNGTGASINALATSGTSAATNDTRRLALCMWYWLNHGVMNENSVDAVNWNTNWLSKFIEEGVRFTNTNGSTCRSATLGTLPPMGTTFCTELLNIFTQINTSKTRHLGTSAIYGANPTPVNAPLFYEAVSQYFVNLIMDKVTLNLVAGPTIATANNVFFDSIILSIFSSQKLYQGLTTPTQQFNKIKELYPIEINLSTGVIQPFQIYVTTVGSGSRGSIDTRSSYFP